jgi:hypothetical protein
MICIASQRLSYNTSNSRFDSKYSNYVTKIEDLLMNIECLASRKKLSDVKLLILIDGILAPLATDSLMLCSAL